MNKRLLMVLIFLSLACERGIVSPEFKAQEFAQEIGIKDSLIFKLKPQVRCGSLLTIVNSDIKLLGILHRPYQPFTIEPCLRERFIDKH